MVNGIVATARRQTIGDIVRRTALRYPTKTGIICGSVSWTYAEFDALVSRLAAGLAAIGVGAGAPVGVLARNSHAFAALRFAVARCGAVLVPINFMLNAAEVSYILRHCGVRTLATDSALAEVARAAAAQDTEVERFIWLPGEEPSEPVAGMHRFAELCACGDAPPEPTIGHQDLAQIIYTSGTESRPKGAMLCHEAVLSQYVSCIVAGEMAADDVVLHALPLFHCAQLDTFFGPAVTIGSTNIITAKPVADHLLALLDRHGATSFFAPPTLWIALLRSPLFDPARLTCLRKGYYGASIMPVEILKDLSARLPDVRLWNFYGQTEMAPVATCLSPEDQRRKPGSAGRPTLNVETRVVDAEMRDVAPGEIGEVVHRSPHLMLGYYREDALTQAAFAGGWFHSGDLATMDQEGYITIVDRKKDVIKSGGENVASREVEEVLYRLAAVSEVAVIGLPDPYWIEAVTAVIVTRQDQSLTETQVVEHCQRHLAHFKCPKRVFFAESLPKNPSGKLLKRELRQIYQSAAG